MDGILGLLGCVAKQLAFEAIVFWPGWAVLKVLTLGRYPRLRGPNRSVADYTEIQFIVFVGIAAVFGLVVLAAKFWPEMVQVTRADCPNPRPRGARKQSRRAAGRRPPACGARAGLDGEHDVPP